MDSKLDKCETYLGVLCSDSKIASQSHTHPGSYGVAVDCSNGWDVEVANGEKEVVELYHGLVIGVRAVVVAIL